MDRRFAGRPKRHVALLAVALLLSPMGGKCGQAAEFRALAAAAGSIDAEEIQAHTDTLADDSFEGREAGQRGGRAAATYVMKKLEALGLSPGGDRGGYFQSFGGYRNVLAVIEGSDEELKDEVIVVGAHFDHVGYGNKRNSHEPGFIHNGADDNASGTAALLEVAEALTKLRDPCRRTILIAFWDAEEKGLLGSKHWVKNPTVPLKNVKFNVNVDMVGRMKDETISVYGTRTAAGLRRLVSEQNSPTDLHINYVWWINPRSDHYTFVQQDIPVLLLHTGLHSDYHQPSDDAHKLNIEGITRASHLLFHLVCELSDRDELPAWRKSGVWESASQRKQYEAPPVPAPPRLGVSWDVKKPDELPGLPVKQVTRNSAAFHAGVEAGDRIVRLDGHEINTGDDLRRRVVTAESKVAIVVQREGEPSPLTLNATLPGEPVRLGITWRENDAEPGAVTIVAVADGSPADDAGVRPMDRIYAVGGDGFADSDEFERRVTAFDDPLNFLIDRDGRLLSVRVELRKKEASASQSAQ